MCSPEAEAGGRSMHAGLAPRKDVVDRTRRSEVRFRGQIGKQLLTSRLTGFDPKRSSFWPASSSLAALASDRQRMTSVSPADGSQVHQDMRTVSTSSDDQNRSPVEKATAR